MLSLLVLEPPLSLRTGFGAVTAKLRRTPNHDRKLTTFCCKPFQGALSR